MSSRSERIEQIKRMLQKQDEKERRKGEAEGNARAKRQKEWDEFSENLSIYLKATIGPILEETNEKWLDGEGVLEEIKYTRNLLTQEEDKSPITSRLNLMWNFREVEQGYYSETTTTLVNDEISVEITAGNGGKYYFRVFPDPKREDTPYISSRDRNFKRKIENRIDKMFENREVPLLRK